ncbi:MAG: HAD-IA family hydrolase [Proteobacteria bacterium]|jgi:phosphoglycolate phosphatase|nr:HAD-IA family hydrolase [Pseudomonadota bacterium]
MLDFSKIELLIFDLDGTLIDSAKDLAVCLDLALKEDGLNRHTMDDLMARISIGSKNLLRELVNDDPHAERRVLDSYIRLYSEKMFDNTVLYPDVLKLLDLLKDKKVALLSNKREQPCKVILNHFKIDHHFKIILGGDSLPQRKPRPEPILHICKELDVKPENTLMIGDSPVDLEAGKLAGAKTIGILGGLTPEELMKKSEADIFLHQVRDLIALIELKSNAENP